MEYSPPGHTFPVKYAVLGLLSDTPGHGYEIRERISGGLGAVWYVAMSQLYSVLRRLESEGLVEGTLEEQTGRPARTVYRVTTKGREAFLAWATAPVEHVRDVRVELFAKLYLLRRTVPGCVGRLVAGQVQTLEALQRALDERRGLETDDERLGKVTLEYRRTQVAGALEWLRRHKEELVS